jgi:hypothetical protein
MPLMPAQSVDARSKTRSDDDAPLRHYFDAAITIIIRRSSAMSVLLCRPRRFPAAAFAAAAACGP